MDVERKEGSFVNGRGQRLHTTSHVPAKGREVKACLLFHHGYGEHSGRYHYVFELLAKAGFAVHSYDAHGHGLSEPKEEWDRHLIWDFQHMADDYVEFASTVRSHYAADLPYFIGGHSMGALTSVLVVLRDQAPWQGLVCCSATVDVEWNWFLRAQASVGGILAALIPRARIVPAVKGEDMSSDANAVKEMEEDPLNAVGNVRSRTANEFLKAFRRVYDHEHDLRLPIYAHHGSNDRLANLSAVRRMLKNCQSRDVTLYVVPGGFHEVLMGSERVDVTEHIIAWLSEHVPDGSSQDVASSDGLVSEIPVAEDELSAATSSGSSFSDAAPPSQPLQQLPELKAGRGGFADAVHDSNQPALLADAVPA